MPDETGEVQMTVGAVYFAPYEPHTPVLGIAHLLVTHSTLDYFYVSTEHDTMAFTEMTRIFVEAKDKDGRDVDLPAGTMISVALSTSVQYGGLEYGGRRGIIIDNIPYHDAQSGKVRFAADGEIPMEPNPQPVAIQVSGEGKTGSGVVWVRGSLNTPPEITSVDFEPSRRYFFFGSEVRVRATAIDPDGDDVTISYEPGQTFTLTTFGPVEVVITATDGKGASTTRVEIIYSVAVGITPSRERVIDGGSLDYRVYVAPQDIVPISYHWKGEPQDPAGGNIRPVPFQPNPTMRNVTVSPAWWYASPDSPCSAKFEATYLLSANVIIGDDSFDTEKAEMTVFVLQRAGETPPPSVMGYPGIVAIRDKHGDVVKVKVDHIGTLTRSDVKHIIFIPRTCQFYEKVMAHEMEHVRQFKTGIAKDLWSAEKLFKRLKNLEAVSETLLQQKIDAELDRFEKEELARYIAYWKKMDEDAFAVSDLIPPRYTYQACGRDLKPPKR